MAHSNIPKAFQNQLEQQLQAAYPAFISSLSTPAPVSIRLNPNKPAPIQQTESPVSWCPNAYYLPKRPVFTLDPIFHAGGYYVQEASSMFVAEVIRQCIPNPVVALDLCAAPGGKSTLLASTLPTGSFLLANEVIKNRVSILRQNIHKWGMPNIAISNQDSRDFKQLKHFFDLVLVDAPCSGEGLFRKDMRTTEEWSPSNVQLCAARQQRILEDAASLVKEGGLLIYSTCTYNDNENSHNSQWLIEQHDFEAVNLDIPTEWNIEPRTYGYQFYPHRVQGEGFYIAIFRKRMRSSHLTTSILRGGNFSMKKLPKKFLSTVQAYLERPKQYSFFVKANQQVVAIPSSHLQTYIHIDSALQRRGFGIEMGMFKREQFIPSHQLALSTSISKDLPHLKLTKTQALRYLKKETFELPPQAPLGWTLAQYEGLNLGWIKLLKNRMNNYYPKEWRIQMKID